MKSIKNNIESTYIVNKSKFITKLYKISNEEETSNILADLKKEYKDATHICYAYIINNIKRFNDDNEPNGTAGMPILNVLEHNDLNYVLATVIRYFGGIKLGAGGLTRAYSNSTSQTLKDNITEYILGKQIEITFNYDQIKEIDKLLIDELVVEKSFDNSVIYTINTHKDINFPSNVKVKIKKDVYIQI